MAALTEATHTWEACTFSGKNREEEWWSCYAPQNSAAPTAEESGEGSVQGKGIYKLV